MSVPVADTAPPSSPDVSEMNGAGMARMHELMMDENPGMARMHEQMMDENPGMARMHEQMMDETGPAGPPAGRTEGK
ncbi:hypothetical protein SAMN04489742_3728 [Arthrobacter crystallopoietes]|uniref:Uncharacterized protein n=1 Tax=Crystallibacter crystallopoietes TaxID=37928 RepID=A0A1H1FZ09_9MICC|nr:hypothetical protein SAMN04489742_3728 [Arthrobacter crystallopoietes]